MHTRGNKPVKPFKRNAILQSDEAEILELYNEGYIVQELADLFGYRLEQVNRLCLEKGQRTLGKKRDKRALNMDEISDCLK